ncbi:MAG: peptide-methionine (R)-S-oxide reductase [Blastocatellia bacterium]
MKLRLLVSLLSAVLFAAVIAAGVATRSITASSSNLSAEPSTTPSLVAKKKKPSARKFEFIDEWNGEKLERSDNQWKRILTPSEFYILRRSGTERSYTGRLLYNKREGTYYCAACGLALFHSGAKYDSKTGWLSFYQPISKDRILEIEDRSVPEEVRTEVRCARCGSHLGHVFDDGPPPTGLRYCMNSIALRFRPAK